ncbi:MAG TPA: response regulator transcription factor [Ideonella sp.]|uniref:response regulator transcription factor n=1 Tax=Ideonella sp. TaxID=1929293 RepID=UPI002C433CA8|nr:response regulator transcription factor [Ideonella sp.]HSI49782.1 response regulator transcription factor [Ideonella sp.]
MSDHPKPTALPAPDRRPHPAARVLVVDPDANSRQWLSMCLEPHGHQVQATDDTQLIEHAGRRGFELLVMDPSPSRSGHRPDAWQQLRNLRELGSHMPVLVLQAASHAADRAVALELGADAVLDKPFHPGELRARVGALLRRSRDDAGAPPPVSMTAAAAAKAASAMRFGQWRLDPATRSLEAPTGLRVPLSQAEFRLLKTFLAHPHCTLDRQQLLDLARGEGVEQLDRSIDLLVSRLRHKLDDNSRSPQLIRTVRGVGYLFAALEESPKAKI